MVQKRELKKMESTKFLHNTVSVRPTGNVVGRIMKDSACIAAMYCLSCLAQDGGRTAPSAMNTQEIDLYVTMKEGLFFYDAHKNVLQKIHNKDIQALTGKQNFVQDASLNIIMVADHSRLKNKDETQYIPADAAFISENMYLYCASEGLATVYRQASISQGNGAKAAAGSGLRAIGRISEKNKVTDV